MAVMRIHKTKNYTVMSNYHFKEKGLSLKAKGLLSLMLSLPEDWNYSVSGLVKLSKDGKDSVMSALAELEKYGYLHREKLTNDKGQFSGIEYNIYEEPQEEFPVAGKQILEKQTTEKQDADNPRQLNTKALTTKNNKIIYNINNYMNLLESISDSNLRNLYVSFLENRNAMGEPMTIKGFELLIERVREIAGIDIERQKSLVRNAVINNWKNVYMPQADEEPDAIKRLKEFYLED